jgi:methoxymalonate biosynthesis acyl carrier protein
MHQPADFQTLIARFIGEELIRAADATVDPEENLFTSGYVDSVGIMRLIAYLESTLHIAIPPTDLVPDHFRSINAMTAYLVARLDQESTGDRRQSTAQRIGHEPSSELLT